MRFASVVRATVVAASFWAGIPSHAATVAFDSIGDSATFNYSTSIDGANLEASILFSLDSLAANAATFQVRITNSSSGAVTGPKSNRIVGFGVAVVNPQLTSAAVPDPDWDAILNIANFPGGFGHVDFCAYAGSTCQGGSNSGVLMGQTDTFFLNLTFATAVGAANPIQFSSPFPSKWQSVGTSGQSQEFDVRCGSNCGDTHQSVPEPGTLALFGLGLAGLAASRKRKQT